MPELDPLTTLASTLHRAPGAYALLLGSGLSRTAGILTGYQVMCDLIGRIAAAEGETVADDPATWYASRYGEQPAYDRLVARLAPGPADRQALLRTYFEASAEDRAIGRKLPTAAHRAIAQLVARGTVRVILTTNFDPLLELALEAQGVRPQVLASESQAACAIPLAHAPVTILKVNGDYRDAGMRNTTAELAAYGSAMADCIARAFTDYGLVVCGWSATYDVALRDLLRGAPRTAYSTFWADLKGHAPEPASTELIAARGARTISIGGADAFFEDVEQRVQSLACLDAPPPLSGQLAADRVKRYLRDGHAIDLEDLVLGEVERLRAKYAAEPPIVGINDADTLRERLATYEADVAPLLAILVTGCWWAPEKAELWARAIADLGRFVVHTNGKAYGAHEIERYPAMLALYAAVLAAFARQEWALLYRLLLETRVRVDRHVDAEPLLSVFHVFAPFVPFLDFPSIYAAVCPEEPDSLYRESLRLRAALRPAFAPVHLTDRFARTLLECEGFLALVYAWMSKPPRGVRWYPTAPGVTRHAVREQIRAQAKAAGTSWEPLQAGFFDGSVDVANEALGYLDQGASAFLTLSVRASIEAAQPLEN